MRRLLILTLILPVTACVNVSDSAICDGLKNDVDRHAEALLADGGDLSVVSGDNLIAKFDAACR